MYTVQCTQYTARTHVVTKIILRTYYNIVVFINHVALYLLAITNYNSVGFAMPMYCIDTSNAIKTLYRNVSQSELSQPYSIQYPHSSLYYGSCL